MESDLHCIPVLSSFGHSSSELSSWLRSQLIHIPQCDSSWANTHFSTCKIILINRKENHNYWTHIKCFPIVTLKSQQPTFKCDYNQTARSQQVDWNCDWLWICLCPLETFTMEHTQKTTADGLRWMCQWVLQSLQRLFRQSSQKQHKWLKWIHLLPQWKVVKSVRCPEPIMDRVWTIYILFFFFELSLSKMITYCLSHPLFSSETDFFIVSDWSEFAFQTKSMALCCCLCWQRKHWRLPVDKYWNQSCCSLSVMKEKEKMTERSF